MMEPAVVCLSFLETEPSLEEQTVLLVGPELSLDFLSENIKTEVV